MTNKHKYTLIALAITFALTVLILAVISIGAKPFTQKEEVPVSSVAPYSNPGFNIPEVEVSPLPESSESSDSTLALEILIDGEGGHEEQSIDRDAVSLPALDEPVDNGPGGTN